MDFFQILVLASPGPYARTVFEFLTNKMHFPIFHVFLFFVFVNMGPYGGENFKT